MPVFNPKPETFPFSALWLPTLNPKRETFPSLAFILLHSTFNLFPVPALFPRKSGKVRTNRFQK